MEIIEAIRKYDYNTMMDGIRNRIHYCWNDCIKLNDIEEWLDNFQGKVFDVDNEKILALMLLNNFIYLSHNEVLHLCRVIFYEYMHTIAVEGQDYNKVINHTTFYPIGNPSESSSLVMYFFRIANDIPKDRFDYYPRVANNENRVVFIDDISSSGQQAGKYIKKYLETHGAEKKYISYMTLIGTKEAAKIFKELNVNFKSACLLDSRMKLFSDNSYTKFNNDERIILCKFVKDYKNEVNWCPLGYKNSELALGFYYNVPDNCLPIFWSEHDRWKSIFKRFHKKYNSNQKGEVFNDRDKFI